MKLRQGLRAAVFTSCWFLAGTAISQSTPSYPNLYNTYELWHYDASGSDPAYDSQSYLLGIQGNLHGNDPAAGGVYMHIKTDAYGGQGFMQTFTVDAFDLSDHYYRPFFIQVPQDHTTQHIIAGFQADEILFNDDDGSPGMSMSMIDHAFYMRDNLTIYQNTSGTGWSSGINSGGQFIIGAGYNIFASPAITIRPSNLQTSFGGPVQLKSIDPGSLPSAATVGAGAVVYLNTGSIAYSDGSGWLILSGSTSSSSSNITQLQSTPSSSVPAPGRRVIPVRRATTHPLVSAQVPLDPTIESEANDVPAETSTTTRVNDVASARVDAAALPDPLTAKLDALGGDVHRATGGVAAAMALGGVFIPPDDTFAVSFNLATFAGERGLAASAVGKMGQHVYINAGVATSTAKRSTGARVGVTFGW